MPGVFLELANGHKCLCKTCSPAFSSDLEQQLIRKIHRERQAEITEATNQRLVEEATKKFPTIDAEIRGRVEASAQAKWENFLEKELESKKKDIENSAREEFNKKLTRELRTNLRIEVRKKLLDGLKGGS